MKTTKSYNSGEIGRAAKHCKKQKKIAKVMKTRKTTRAQQDRATKEDFESNVGSDGGSEAAYLAKATDKVEINESTMYATEV